MANTMSKSELIQRIVDGHPNEIARKDVKGVIDAVAAIGPGRVKIAPEARSSGRNGGFRGR
jgi:hypothetical protein